MTETEMELKRQELQLEQIRANIDFTIAQAEKARAEARRNDAEGRHWHEQAREHAQRNDKAGAPNSAVSKSNG